MSASQTIRSGLSHVGLPVQGGAVPRGSGVTLIERPVMGLIMLRATSATTSLSAALKSRCGVALSARLQSQTHEGYCIRWMSPDCWLLSCPLDEVDSIEQALRAEVSGHIAIVNVSGGYSVLELIGLDAREVLMKSTGYDTHPDHFTVDKVVNTTFAKAQVTMRAIAPGDVQEQAHYELIVRRSFSDYVWLWLQQAGSEYRLHAVTSEL